MRLRNKKTGELGQIGYVATSGGEIIVEDISGDEYPYSVISSYKTLAELNEEWEDYKPTEPLIKDEKIRKFVQDWAKFNEVKRAYINQQDCNDAWYQIIGQDEAGCCWEIQIHASYSETISEDYRGNTIPITELCWEEE